jgi:hypothetical protein
MLMNSPIFSAPRPLIARSLPVYLCEAIRIWSEIHQNGVQDQSRNLGALAAVACDQMLQHPDPKTRAETMEALFDAIRNAMARAHIDGAQSEHPILKQ